MRSTDEDNERLWAAGFKSGPKYSLVLKVGRGTFQLYRPEDTRSGKYELSYEVGGESRTDFPPTNATGVLRHVRAHRHEGRRSDYGASRRRSTRRRTTRRSTRRRHGNARSPRKTGTHMGWNVSLGGKWINRVFWRRTSQSMSEQAEDIRRGLIDHDGYDPGIKVSPERRK